MKIAQNLDFKARISILDLKVLLAYHSLLSSYNALCTMYVKNIFVYGPKPQDNNSKTY